MENTQNSTTMSRTVQETFNIVSNSKKHFCIIANDRDSAPVLMNKIKAQRKLVLSLKAMEMRVVDEGDPAGYALTRDEFQEQVEIFLSRDFNREDRENTLQIKDVDVFMLLGFENFEIPILFQASKEMNGETSNSKLFNGKQVIFIVRKTVWEKQNAARSITGRAPFLSSPTFIRLNPTIINLLD